MQQRSKEKELFRASGIWFKRIKPLLLEMEYQSRGIKKCDHHAD